jgi:hypothetical protein
MLDEEDDGVVDDLATFPCGLDPKDGSQGSVEHGSVSIGDAVGRDRKRHPVPVRKAAERTRASSARLLWCR